MAKHNYPSINPSPKVQGLGTVLKHVGQCVYQRESILEQNGQGSLTLLSRWLLLKVLEVRFLKIPKVIDD
jgi:hypothetical protein